MTTIVASSRLGGIAADRRVSTAGAYYPAKKLFWIGDSIIGTAGQGDACLAFVEWFKTPPKKRKPKELYEALGGDMNIHIRDEISIIELNPKGIFSWTGWGYGEEILAEDYAIGSGGMAALAALRHGASLEESVRAAMGIDEYTGCHIDVEYLDLPKELKRYAGHSPRKGKA